jgi:hypothetical protein
LTIVFIQIGDLAKDEAVNVAQFFHELFGDFFTTASGYDID